MTVRIDASKPQKTFRSWFLSPTMTAGALMGGTIGAYAAGPAGALAGVVIGGATGAAYGVAVDSAARRLDHGSNASVTSDDSRDP